MEKLAKKLTAPRSSSLCCKRLSAIISSFFFCCASVCRSFCIRSFACWRCSISARRFCAVLAELWESVPSSPPKSRLLRFRSSAAKPPLLAAAGPGRRESGSVACWEGDRRESRGEPSCCSLVRHRLLPESEIEDGRLLCPVSGEACAGFGSGSGSSG